MSERHLVRYPDPRLMATAVAERLLLRLNDLLSEPGRERADIALTGGTDGTAILKAIAGSELLEIVDWSRIHVWWGDERFVPANSEERNAVGARQALLDDLVERGLIEESQIHEMPADRRMEEEIASASKEENARLVAAAAANYQHELIEELGPHPAMDIAMFGLGPDGHFASLFPDMEQVTFKDPATLCVGVVDSPKLPPLRVSFTVPMIAASGQTWICATRDKKAQAVLDTYSNVDNPSAPASYADAKEGSYWLVDRDAAALL